MKLKKADDIVDRITPASESCQLLLKVASKTGAVFSIKEKQCLGFFESDVLIDRDVLVHDEFAKLDALERFLVYERFIYKAMKNGPCRTGEELALDKIASKEYYLHHVRKRLVIVDGVNTKCGHITLDHHFKNPKRIRRKSYDLITSRAVEYDRYDLSKPGKAIQFKIANYLMSAGSLSYKSVWDMLGWADYRLPVSRAIKSLRNYVLAYGNIEDHLTLHDYSNMAQPVAETIAHLLGFGYTSHFGHQTRLAFSKSEKTTHLNIALLANLDDMQKFLESGVDEAVVITYRKKEFINATIATGKYSVSGIDQHGVQNYVYVKLKP